MDVSPAELDPSFEPLQRARSNTWPLPRPENFDDSSMSPTVTHSGDAVIGGAADSTSCGAALVDNLGLDTKCGVIPELVGSSSLNAAAAYHCNQLKKGSSRRNAWGNLSYADLITQAINSSPEKRLTLSQIYEWMVHNVPYFKDKGDNNSSAGWKNSIRHNLSLHNRFMRVQNEGTGKSSWWMLNPDAKPGKSTRRRATSMETSKFEKRRGRVKKKVDALRNGLDANISPSSSVSETVDQFPDSPLLGFQPSPDFRTRASSNASSCGRLSPIPAVEAEWTMNFNNSYIPPDQLAGSLEQRMKINSGSDTYLYQNSSYQQHQAAHSPAGVYSRSPFSQVTPASSQNCLIHQLQPCNCNFLTCDVKHNLSSPIISRSSNSSPATPFFGIDPTANLLDDLNINIEQFPTDFECNVEEVLRHEISLGGSLDFNFPTSNLTTSNPSAIAHSQTSTAAAAAAAAAATVATSSNHGQPSFNDHSWVH